MEVLKAVREAVDPAFPVFIKLNSEDFLTGGLTVDDMLQTSAILEETGIDAIEMSGDLFLRQDERLRRGKPGPGEPNPTTRWQRDDTKRRFKFLLCWWVGYAPLIPQRGSSPIEWLTMLPCAGPSSVNRILSIAGSQEIGNPRRASLTADVSNRRWRERGSIVWSKPIRSRPLETLPTFDAGNSQRQAETWMNEKAEPALAPPLFVRLREMGSPVWASSRAGQVG